MTIHEYETSLKNPLRPRCVAFFLRDQEVLLGYKKRGFGKGNYVGIGGKVEEAKKETVLQAARREAIEEIGVTNTRFRRVGGLNFYFPHIEDESWNQRVHVLTTKLWKGEPKETEEIRPQWFPVDSVPYNQMWDDAHYWLPQVLKGEIIDGSFLFDKSLKVVDYTMKTDM